MSYLLDTNVLIYYLDNVDAATELVDQLANSGIAISVVTYAELRDGVDRSSHPLLALHRFTRLLSRLRVINFSRKEADQFIFVRQVLRQYGRQVRRRSLDLQIAATALAHDLTLVTNDPDDFAYIPNLRIYAAQITP